MARRLVLVMTLVLAAALGVVPLAASDEPPPGCTELNAGALDGVYPAATLTDFSRFTLGDEVVIRTSAVEAGPFAFWGLILYAGGLGTGEEVPVGTSRTVTITAGLTLVEWRGDNVRWDLSCVPSDADADGVDDTRDLCAGTVLPDTFSRVQKANRLGADDAGAVRYGDGTDSGYTLTDTGGCSALQIIDRAGLGNGHTRYGLSTGALLAWVSRV